MIETIKKITRMRFKRDVWNIGENGEVWDFHIYNEKENTFTSYNIVQMYGKRNKDGKECIEWKIQIDENSTIAQAFLQALEEEAFLKALDDDMDSEYQLTEWKKQYAFYLETDAEVIKFLEENVGVVLEEVID